MLFGESGLVFEEIPEEKMGGEFEIKAKSTLYEALLKKTSVYTEIFDNLGSILSTLYTIDLIILDNTNFQNYW
jgi:hypothetical protein